MLRLYRDLVADAPDELTTILNLRHAPALPFAAAELHGRPVVAVDVCYAGAVERGEQVLAPLRRFGRPLLDAIAPRPYVRAPGGSSTPAVPHGWHYYWKSWELPPLSDGAIDALVEHAARITSPRSYLIVFQLGGAVARVGEHETAYGQRDAAHNVNINAVWLPGDPARDEHVALGARVLRRARALPRPAASTSTSSATRARSACAPPTARSATRGSWRSSAAYDPDNVFRLNQNIDPRGLDSAA